LGARARAEEAGDWDEGVGIVVGVVTDLSCNFFLFSSMRSVVVRYFDDVLSLLLLLLPVVL
jgi:hypothetical protein